MYIRAVIADKDQIYTGRLAEYFRLHTDGKIELYICSDMENLERSLNENQADVLLFTADFSVDNIQIPKTTAVAGLTDDEKLKYLDGKPAICKYQKALNIYNELLNLYEEKEAELAAIEAKKQQCKIVSFLAAGGGTGVTTAATACALSFAKQGLKVMYLNMDPLGFDNPFLAGAETGVSYYNPVEKIWEMRDLTEENLIPLFEGWKEEYDAIVIDQIFSFENRELCLLEMAEKLVFVLTGSKIGTAKFEKLYNGMKNLEQQEYAALTEKIKVFYNDFRLDGHEVSGFPVEMIAKLPHYKDMDQREIILAMTRTTVFQKL